MTSDVISKSSAFLHITIYLVAPVRRYIRICPTGRVNKYSSRPKKTMCVFSMKTSIRPSAYGDGYSVSTRPVSIHIGIHIE